jgi:nucleoside-diphosphate-sugar epimerase
MTVSNYHALVIGASGLIGWSVVNQILSPYPSPSPFTKITALVNRPLRVEDSFWPAASPGCPELVLVPGVDLLRSDDEFETHIMEKVQDAASISHVYYCGASSTL